jgi:hypothetical protein
MDPEAYMKRALKKGVVFTLEDEALLEETKHEKPIAKEEKIDYYLK